MKLLSQGRLREWASRIRFGSRLGPLEMGAAAAILVLISGIWIGLEFEHTQRDRLEITEQEHLLSQSRVYHASIQHQLEQIRNNVLESSDVDLSLFGVRHWAQIQIQDTSTGPNPVVAFSEAIQIPPEVQVSYVQFLRNKMASLVDAHKAAPRSQYAFLFPMALQQFSEWLLVVFPPPTAAATPTAPVAKAKTERPQWLAVLVDPSVAFSLFSSVASAADSMTTRAFLISQSGYVIAHSQKAYSGTNLSTSEFFLKGILPKFEPGAPAKATFGAYETIDHLPVQASVTRIEGFPLALVVEKVQGPSESRMESLKHASVLRSAGKILLLLGGVGGMALGVALFWPRRRKSQGDATATESDPLQDLIVTAVIPPETPAAEAPATELHFTNLSQAAAMAEAVVTNPTPATPESLAPSASATASAAAGAAPTHVTESAPPTDPLLDTTLPVHVTYAEANRLSREFEREVKDLRDTKVIMALLAEKASRILESPVLFLRYQPKAEVLMLEARAGFQTPNPPAELNVPVSREVQSQVLTSIRVNQVPFFGEWRPLAKPILASLNIAHFEAWGVTLPVRDPENFEGNKKTFPFAGVLVILQPGVQSTLHQPSLFRMIRTAGVAHVANEIWKRHAPNLKDTFAQHNPARAQGSTENSSRSELTRALWELPDDQEPNF